MRVRLERYEAADRAAQTRSVLAFVLGGLGGLVFGFVGFLGVLILLMPTKEGGDPVWERRSGIVLTVFLGAVPVTIAGLVIAWGARERARFRRFGELAAIARQSPELTTPQIAHALRLSPLEAERLIISAASLGLIDDGPHPAATTAPPAAGGVVTAPPAAGGVVTAPRAAGAVVAAPPAASAASALAATVGAPGGHGANAPRPPPREGGRAPRVIGFGSLLGDAYRVEEPLGEGGMGQVHAARHLRTGRRYAVKTILAGADATEGAMRRFEREATAASALGHPGIVQVHDFNVTPDGLFYLVMDLLEGETLERRLARGAPLPWPEAQRIAVELCDALAAAHEHGLLHRDIKPSNVFLAGLAGAGRQAGGPERTVLVDFGLVKPLFESGSRVTSTGAVVGTPMYMSPEQARGEALDLRSDLYNVAAVVFEMLTGAPPFADRTPASVYARLLREPPPRASQVSPRKVPGALDEVLLRGLAKDRAARYPSARALGQALAAVVDDEPASAAGPNTERMTS
jgi:serine/threonine-protein kinase